MAPWNFVLKFKKILQKRFSNNKFLALESMRSFVRFLSSLPGTLNIHFFNGCFSGIIPNLYIRRMVVSPNIHLKPGLFGVPGFIISPPS